MQRFTKAQRILAAAVAGVLVCFGIIVASIAGLVPSPFSSEKTGFSDEYALVLQDMQGNEVRLSEFKNDILVAYVWASWCPYCAQEIDNLAALKQQYGERIQVLAINRSEPKAVAQAYIAQLPHVSGVTFLLDPNDAFFKQVGGYAMPETMFIRGRGEVVFHQRGPMQLQEVQEQLTVLLGTK